MPRHADARPEIAVAVLTGGGDRPYVLGLAAELISKGAAVDLIGSDGLDLPEFQNVPGLDLGQPPGRSTV